MVSGYKPFIIPIFLRHQGCPHRCVFCNQHALDAEQTTPLEPEDLRRHTAAHLAFKKPNRHPVEVAFYGGNFLGMDRSRVHAFLKAGTALVNDGAADEIRLSTRPDTITKSSLDWLSGFPVVTVEVGAQSMDDRVLAASGRGHLAADTARATDLLKERGYRIGIQVMVGLPGDTEETSFSSAKAISGLSPDFVRIYPTVVLKESLLAAWYHQGRYSPWTLTACVSHVKKLYLHFSQKKIRVIRMGLQPSKSLVPGGQLIAGPFHPAFGHLVQSEIFKDALVAFLDQSASVPDPLNLSLHPSLASKTAGHANKNIAFLKTRYRIGTIRIRQDAACPKDCLYADGTPIPVPA